MALMTLTDARFDYGREKILDGVGLSLHAGCRYALVGPNGAGKTTLLAILAGEAALQGGQRQTMGGLRMRQLRQESVLGLDDEDSRVLREAVRATAFGRELALQAELEEVGRALVTAAFDEQAELVRRQGHLQSEFERLDGYTLDARLESALLGVGLPASTWDRPLGRLSGGERRRAALAATLLGEADLLLLDEPTNHLDLESCEWLEGFLRQSPASMVMVSHDRYFLDRVAERTLHLESGRLADYAGNYTVFLQLSRERRQQELAAWQRQQDQIRQTEAFIRKNIEGQKTKQAQSRRKALARLDRVDRPVAEHGLYRFDLNAERTSGGTVLQAEGLAKSYGERTLFADLDLLVVRGERVGILGPNGCGKSTLLHVMAGQISPDRGRVVRGMNVDLGVYDQNLQLVSDLNTVIGEMQAVDPGATLGELRSFLGAFGFGEDLYDRSVAQLSGGERGRLALLRLIKEGHNTLLLDEPTNHLDVRSRESLEAALKDFEGTIIVVSHDRRFLDTIVERLIVFPPSGTAAPVRLFLGTYGDLVRSRAAAPVLAAPVVPASRPASAEPSPPTTQSLSKNALARRRSWVAEVEAEIAALEDERNAVFLAMARGDLDGEQRRRLAARSEEIDEALAGAMARWETWQEELVTGQASLEVSD